MYRDINDYETLYMISDSDDDYFEIMLEKYTPLMHKGIKKYKYIAKKFGYEEDDLYQIASIALYKAIYNFNHYDKDNLFYTFYMKLLENEFLSFIRLNSTNKKKVLNESISYDNNVPNTDLSYIEVFPDYSTFNEPFLDDLELKYNNFKNSLEFELACILDLRIEGYTVSEIANLLDITESIVRHSLRKFKDKRHLFE